MFENIIWSAFYLFYGAKIIVSTENIQYLEWAKKCEQDFYKHIPAGLEQHSEKHNLYVLCPFGQWMSKSIFSRKNIIWIINILYLNLKKVHVENARNTNCYTFLNYDIFVIYKSI